MTVDTTTKQQVSQKATRPPIVVVLGHIDHGKSQMLETIRKTKMLEKEAGGITQHIGAYMIEHSGKHITFIDTPGHEAFSKMRSRGAHVADIAILVVAANEGVKAQTKEVIKVIKDQTLPYVVAINKIDSPDANPERVKQELAEADVLVESYGGDVPSVEISALTGEHIDELLEMILLVAEVEHFETDMKTETHGVVIESHCDPRRGITTTLLVREGVVTNKDTVVIGRALESIRVMEDFLGTTINSASASMPVLLAGLSSQPIVGDTFRAFPDKKSAEKYLNSIPAKLENREVESVSVQDGENPIFNLIIKADVAGSKEALEDMIRQINPEVINIKILSSGVGDINESDIKLAIATKSVTIVGFKVRTDTATLELAKNNKVRIITSAIIYEVIDELKKRISEMLPPDIQQREIGTVKILKIFKNKNQKEQVVGGRVEQGVIKNNTNVSINRDKDSVGTGKIKQLQHGKEKVEELTSGSEFGVTIDATTLIKEGDVLNIIQEEIMKQTL